MHLGIFAAIDVFVLLCLRQQLHLCFMSEFFGYNAFLQTVHQKIIVLLNQSIVVSGACTFSVRRLP